MGRPTEIERVGPSLVYTKWARAHTTQIARVGLFDKDWDQCSVHTDWAQSAHSHTVGMSLVHKKCALLSCDRAEWRDITE